MAHSDEVAYSVATWDSHDPTVGEFLDRLAGFIRGLREIDPVFSELYLPGNRAKQGLRVEDPLGNLENFLRTTWPKSVAKWHTAFDDFGRPGLPRRSRTGWNLMLGASTGRRRDIRSNFFKLYGHPGSIRPARPGIVKMSVFDRNSPLLDPEVSERLFRYLVGFWNPGHAITSELIFEARSGGFGWLNYWADPNFARHLPDRVHREPLGRGVFFRLGDGRVLSTKDTEELDTGRAIYTALRAAIQNDAPPPA